MITIEDLHEIVDALATALDAKTPYNCRHSERVADIALLLAKGMALPPVEQERIHMGAHLHDIGKIGIPDAILNKPGQLTADEFALIRQHPVIGDTIVGKIKVFRELTDIVRYHHERYDGTGYPDRLSGDSIPLGARIVAVADSFDAMIIGRPYRPALSLHDAIAEISRCRGSQFDPKVVDVLVALVSSGELSTPRQEVLFNHC